MFEGMFEIFNEEKEKEEQESQQVSYTANVSPSNTFVVSVGGSVLMDGKPNSEAIDRISGCLNELIRDGKKLVLVVGGGKVARDYVNSSKQLGASNFELDELGIAITRANASLLLSTIENAFPAVLTDVKKSREVLSQGKTPIYGGLIPGFTTDAVAALLAEYLNATFINLSNVDGIFTADPAAYPSARLYRELGYNKLLEILVSNAMKPAQNLVLDLPAAMILKRSSITAFFLNGNDLENFKSAVHGLQFHGTIVREGSEDLLGDETEISRPKRRRTLKSKTAKRRKTTKSVTRLVKRKDEEPSPDNIRF